MRTSNNLAVIASLVFVAVFRYLRTGALDKAKALFKQVFTMLQNTGLPGEHGSALPECLDDWLVREYWLRLFWSALNFELWVSNLPLVVTLTFP